MRLGLMRSLCAEPVPGRAAMPSGKRSRSGTLWVVGQTGSAGKLAWRTDRADECALARSVFDSMLRKGYGAFVVGSTRPARSITAFEPALAQLMLVPGPASAWEDCDAAAWTRSVGEARSLLRHWAGVLRNRSGATPRRQPAGARETLRQRRELLAALLTLLNQRQRRQFRESGNFIITGGASGVHYRLRADATANIDQLDERGAVQYRLDLVPACELPLAGRLVMQLLHLQDAETEHAFLASAQVFPAPARVPRC